MKFFDAHSHLTEGRFDSDLDELRSQIVSDMQAAGMGTISIGTDLGESRAACSFAAQHAHVWASIGQHPVDNKTEIFDAQKYEELYQKYKEKIVCVGECGLDYYWPKKDVEAGKMSEEEFEGERRRQIALFNEQIDFAAARNLPLMMHVRSYKNGDAHRDALEILDAENIQHGGSETHNVLRGNFHFFTETPEIAQDIIARGFYISFPGVTTFADLDETVRAVPAERILSETDSPYAAPKPFRGQNASPLMVSHIVEKIAEIKKLDQEAVRLQILKNVQELFRI